MQRRRAETAYCMAPSAPAVQDWSWYSHELRPPFVGELFENEDTVDVVYAGSATFTIGGRATTRNGWGNW